MTDNPYAPPKANVVLEAEPTREKPREIVVGIRLIWLSFVVAVPITIYDLQHEEDSLIPYLITFALCVLLVVKISRGRNWARNTWLVASIIALPFIPFALPEYPTWYIVLALASSVVNGAGLYQMFTPPGSAWFRARP
jgi:hypothetical protein